jgi:DNA polymerase I
METLVFDIETNGYLEATDRIHCMTITSHGSGKFDRYRGDNLEAGIRRLHNADAICGHNIIKFDIPAIQKIYPWFKPQGIIRDTLVMTRLMFPTIRDTDFGLARRGAFPTKMIGRHSLEAWGYRLGNYKGDFKGPWEFWTQEMDDYCEQDVRVTDNLLTKLESLNYSAEAIETEHRVQEILWRQEQNGVGFDVAKAAELYAMLAKRKQELTNALREIFPPFYIHCKDFTPKRDNKRLGYKADCPMCKIELVEFNPASNPHVALKLQELGWKPKEFTPTGEAKVDESTLKPLEARYGEPIKLLLEFFTINKRCGQLAEGDQAWLKVEQGGKIHGGVNPMGAYTSRMTHIKPNMAQVPSVDHPYGKECRELFRPTRPGWVQVGCDASGLELRCLSHYMARYDGGAYGREVVDGDVHTANRMALELIGDDGAMRQIAKRFIYAFLYGAGNGMLSTILQCGVQAAGGKRKKFLENLPALARLIADLRKVAQERGYFFGLDGRKIPIKSIHAVVATLCQSAGAVVMKKALVILDEKLQRDVYLTPGVDYEFMLNVHDEYQIECKPELAEVIGQTAVWAIKAAGEHFKFRCPLDGEYKIGKNWKETH